MGFSLQYSEESVVQLGKLEGETAKRIIKKLESTLSNPRSFFKKLGGRPEYKLRVGDYRVIANLNEQKCLVIVRSVGHRRDIYEKH